MTAQGMGQLLVGDVFRNAARAVPDRVAAALGSETLTFGELDERANGVARELQTRGVGQGHVVAVRSGTTLDVIPVFAAAAKIGAVFAPMNPALSPGEADAIISLAQPRVLLDGEMPSGGSAGGDIECPDLNERDTHVVFFTSGSTGQPKGAVLSHRVNFLRSHPGALLEERGAMVCPYPLFHMGAWTIALQQWQARDCVVFPTRADADSICEALERHRAARINCIPAVWRRVLDHLDGRRMEWVRFADTGTSATPPELLEAIRAAFPNAQVRVFYGSTEAGGVASLAHADLRRKPGSCGVPAPSTEVRIADDGELQVRGPLLFDGYYRDPSATGDAFADGWYRTGDLVDADAEGYLTITGRARDIVRTGGETVAPAEVEAVLAQHPGVADVAVIGLPDTQWGEVVCAVVVPVLDAPSLEELRAFCADRLAEFKHPRRLHVIDAIPRTPATHQVQRRLLVERVSLP